MSTFTSRIRAKRLVTAGGLVSLITLLLAGASVAAPQPQLFIGNVEMIVGYRDGVHCGPNVYGPDQGPCKTNGTKSGATSSPTYTASVDTKAGNAITVAPWMSWQRTTGPVTTFTGYPYFIGYRSRTQLTTGSFYPGYQYQLATSKTYYFYARTTPPPQVLPKSPRIGFIRIKAGPNQFGGSMPQREYGYFDQTRAAAVKGFYTENTVMIDRLKGARGLPKGGIVQTAAYGALCTGQAGTAPYPFGTGCAGTGTGAHSTLTVAGTPLMVGSLFADTHFGFFTGTVTRNDYINIVNKFSSITGMDSRVNTKSGITGKLSMVSPILVWTYDTAFGSGSVQRLRSGFGGVARINMNFLPEPGRLALLASGILGLLALNRARRR